MNLLTFISKNKLSLALGNQFREVSEIEGFSASCETPVYIYNLFKLKHNLSNFKSLFKRFEVFYSVKTNPNDEVLKLFLNENSNFDAATIGEIEKLILLGVNPKKILWTHPIKNQKEIDKALSYGVHNLTVDSLEETEKLKNSLVKINLFLRVLPPSDGDFYQYTDKFGMPLENVKDFILNCKKNNIHLAGLSFHVGSQNMSLKPWRDVLLPLADLYKFAESQNIPIKVLNIGSGFPVQYSFDKCLTLTDIKNGIEPILNLFPSGVDFWCEPGRVLVADSVDLICSVVQKVKRRTSRWLFVDMGVYHGLIEILESQGKLRYKIGSINARGNLTSYNIGGWTLDPDDNIALNVLLPESIQIGDRLCVKSVGAYTHSLFSNYHSLPQPKIQYFL